MSYGVILDATACMCAGLSNTTTQLYITKTAAKAIAKLIKDGKGKAMIKTVSGGTLTAWTKGDNVYVTDENGNSAMVTIADVNQSNGVIHVIDTVLLPKS